MVPNHGTRKKEKDPCEYKTMIIIVIKQKL